MKPGRSTSGFHRPDVGGVGGGACLFVACLSRLTGDHASLSRQMPKERHAGGGVLISIVVIVLTDPHIPVKRGGGVGGRGGEKVAFAFFCGSPVMFCTW